MVPGCGRSGSIMGKNRLNSTSPEQGDGGVELGQAGRVLQLLGVLAVRELGCGVRCGLKGQLGLPGSPA